VRGETLRIPGIVLQHFDQAIDAGRSPGSGRVYVQVTPALAIPHPILASRRCNRFILFPLALFDIHACPRHMCPHSRSPVPLSNVPYIILTLIKPIGVISIPDPLSHFLHPSNLIPNLNNTNPIPPPSPAQPSFFPPKIPPLHSHVPRRLRPFGLPRRNCQRPL
jgi:hypothetical protein